jgi:hypothetical protein
MCTSGVIDFTARPDTSDRLLGVRFLQTISADPKYTNYYRGKPLVITKAVIKHDTPEASLYYLDLNGIELRSCTISDVTFVNSTIRGIVFIQDSAFDRIRFVSGRFGRITLQKGSEPPRGQGGTLVFDGIDAEAQTLIANYALSNLEIKNGSHIHSNLYISNTHVAKMSVSQSIIDGSILLDRGNNKGSELQIEDSRVGWAIALGGAAPEFDDVRITNTAAARVTLSESTLLKAIRVSGLTFSEWPNDLITTKRFLEANATFDGPLFEQIVKAYKNAGQSGAADDIQFMKKNADYTHSEGFAKFWLFLSWALMGYGLRPWHGFVLFGVLIVIGYFVFRTGQHVQCRGEKPRSWFIFALDTVIPVIKLDKAHDEVAFEGPRQYVLYAMRVLSAGLIFLVAKILGDIIGSY